MSGEPATYLSTYVFERVAEGNNSVARWINSRAMRRNETRREFMDERSINTRRKVSPPPSGYIEEATIETGHDLSRTITFERISPAITRRLVTLPFQFVFVFYARL